MLNSGYHTQMRASKMAQWLKVLATRPYYWNSSPRSYIVEEKFQKLFSDLQTHIVAHMFTYKINERNFKK